MSLLRWLFGEPKKTQEAGAPVSPVRSQPCAPEPGTFRGRHYTAWVDEVKALKREKRHAEAEDILLGCIEAAEAEAEAEGNGWCVPPWYYNNLAIVRRKEKDYAGEIEVIERYIAQEARLGRKAEPMQERLAKAKALLAKQTDMANG